MQHWEPRAHKVDTTPGTHLQHCPGARLCSRHSSQRGRADNQSPHLTDRQTSYSMEAAYPGASPNTITPQEKAVTLGLTLHPPCKGAVTTVQRTSSQQRRLAAWQRLHGWKVVGLGLPPVFSSVRPSCKHSQPTRTRGIQKRSQARPPEPVEVCRSGFNRSSTQNDLAPGCARSLFTQQMRCLEGPACNPCAGR